MNINLLMKQAQAMQKKMKEKQDEIAQKEFEGKSGGGLVSWVMKGDGQAQKLSIDPSVINLEDREMMEDLIIAAYHEARAKVDQESKDGLTDTLGALGSLPGMNTPF